MQFWNEYNLLNPTEADIVSENCMPTTYRYCYLGNRSITPLFLYIQDCEKSMNLYNQFPFPVEGKDEYVSHDQLTTIVNVFYKMGLINRIEGIWDEIKRQKLRYNNVSPESPGWNFVHPRDILYIGFLLKKWWAYLLFPIFALITIESCFSKWKVRPTILNRVKYFFKNFKIQDKIKMISTDGKLLARDKFETTKDRTLMVYLDKICTWIINKKFGGWLKIFEIYYKEVNHPIREILRKKIEIS